MELKRYAKITNSSFKREFILLQGLGCAWKKCTFCDYHLDTSENPFTINFPILSQVTGEFGVLDIINSGSALELDDKTIKVVQQIIHKKNIKEIWFEAHYIYKNRLKEFAQLFAPIKVNFRCGVETFSPTLWNDWQKGIPPNTTASDVAKYFQGICLLVGIKGQKKEEILQDIALAKHFFQYTSVNLFCPNSTQTEQDTEIINWFKEEIYPKIKNEPQFEILLENTDLGVG